MNTVAWAIVFATIEIAGALDSERGQDKLRAFENFMTFVSLCALAMVIACTVRDWR